MFVFSDYGDFCQIKHGKMHKSLDADSIAFRKIDYSWNYVIKKSNCPEWYKYPNAKLMFVYDGGTDFIITPETGSSLIYKNGEFHNMGVRFLDIGYDEVTEHTIFGITDNYEIAIIEKGEVIEIMTVADKLPEGYVIACDRYTLVFYKFPKLYIIPILMNRKYSILKIIPVKNFIIQDCEIVRDDEIHISKSTREETLILWDKADLAMTVGCYDSPDLLEFVKTAETICFTRYMIKGYMPDGRIGIHICESGKLQYYTDLEDNFHPKKMFTSKKAR